MASFQDEDSTFLSEGTPNLHIQTLPSGFKDQDMDSEIMSKNESSFSPKKETVSNKEVIDSSSGRNVEKSYACNVCKKSFSRKFVLVRHIKFCSGGQKNYSCNLCKMSFVQKCDLRRHILVHSKIPTQHSCDQCREVFSKKLDLLKHKKIHLKPKHNCDQCSEVFSRKYELFKHKKIHKCPKQHKCVSCSEVFNRKSDLVLHINSSHKVVTKRTDTSLKDELYEKVKHFKRLNSLGVFTKTTIEPNEENDKDFRVFFDSIRQDLLNELNYQMEVKRTMKWYTIIQVLVSRTTQEGDEETATPHFHSKTIFELVKENIPTHIEDAFSKMISSYEKFNQLGSGWILERILKLEVYSAKCSMC